MQNGSKKKKIVIELHYLDIPDEQHPPFRSNGHKKDWWEISSLEKTYEFIVDEKDGGWYDVLPRVGLEFRGDGYKDARCHYVIMNTYQILMKKKDFLYLSRDSKLEQILK